MPLLETVEIDEMQTLLQKLEHLLAKIFSDEWFLGSLSKEELTAS